MYGDHATTVDRSSLASECAVNRPGRASRRCFRAWPPVAGTVGPRGTRQRRSAPGSTRRGGVSSGEGSVARGVAPSLIGCTGWSVPATVAEVFPGEGGHLARYAGRFRAVEISSSFYRHHLPRTYARWAATVPPDFRFAVKLPRAVTHAARLGPDGLPALARFLAEVAALGDRFGPLLAQLPPSLAFEPARTRAFFAGLAARTGAAVACEPRHPSWFDGAADALLADLRVARRRRPGGRARGRAPRRLGRAGLPAAPRQPRGLSLAVSARRPRRPVRHARRGGRGRAGVVLLRQHRRGGGPARRPRPAGPAGPTLSARARKPLPRRARESTARAPPGISALAPCG